MPADDDMVDRFSSKPGFIPCRSVDDCLNSMKSICQAHKKEVIAQKLERFKQVRWWIVLCLRPPRILPHQQMEAAAISPEAAIDVLLTIPGMKLQDCLSLQHALGSLSNIATVTAEDILRLTSLGGPKAGSLSDFFAEDKSLLA